MDALVFVVNLRDGVSVNTEAMGMTFNDRKEAIKYAVNKLLDEEMAVAGCNPYCYSAVASVAFEEIILLRKEGIRFEKICECFVNAGLLPTNARARSLSHAFLREKKKRGTSTLEVNDNSTKKAAAPIIKPPTSTFPKPELAKPQPDDETSEKERIRKMMGVTVNTGLGKIVKHSDGGFDFD
jgi:hypothetical protein